MKCPKCNTEQESDSVFCDQCREPLVRPAFEEHRDPGIDHSLASRWSRFWANFLDGLPFGIYKIVLGLMISIWGKESRITQILWWILFVALLAWTIYQCVLLTKEGQTVGKILNGIKIVDYTTGEVRGFKTNVLKRSVLNYVLYLIPLYALVDILFIFRKDKRCIHDHIAHTVVVNE